MNKQQYAFIHDVIHDQNNSAMLLQARRNWNNILIVKKKIFECVCKAYAQEKPHTAEHIIASYWLDKYRKEIDECNKHIKRLTWQRKICMGKIKDTNSITEEMIARAKEVPIEQILGEAPEHVGYKRAFFKCPLHNEKTASFCWYKESNRWHCYGACGEGGDVIDLVQKKFDVTFKEAINQLS